MIGKYERGEAVPSVDAAKKIANAFEVSIDYLAGSTSQLLEKNIIRRINDIQQLPLGIKPTSLPSCTLSSVIIKQERYLLSKKLKRYLRGNVFISFYRVLFYLLPLVNQYYNTASAHVYLLVQSQKIRIEFFHYQYSCWY
ncbi:MAG: XRE family transcriptional regulator [Chitinophagaceae bacterium]|nr:MAG: XRE family transcriptional regulator [Chitinophagaceae bacterium]